MSCISEDQVKQNLLANIYAIFFSLVVGATFGFGLAVMADVQIADPKLLGLPMLLFSLFTLIMLLFSLYIFHKTTRREDTF